MELNMGFPEFGKFPPQQREPELEPEPELELPLELEPEPELEMETQLELEPERGVQAELELGTEAETELDSSPSQLPRQLNHDESSQEHASESSRDIEPATPSGTSVLGSDVARLGSR